MSVGVLLGGRSTEHNISLRSGTFIYNTLDRSKFRVKPILISLQGEYFYPEDWDLDWNIPTEWMSQYTNEDYSGVVLEHFCNSLKAKSFSPWTDPGCGDCQIFVLGLHGGEGEDGRIQAFLEYCNIPYTGSGVLASALAMDKFRSNMIFEKQGIPVAKCLDIKKKDFLKHYNHENSGSTWDKLVSGKGIRFPVFSKPTTGGSSVGTFLATNKEDWEQKILTAFESEERMLVQENIKGREVSCGVLEVPEGNVWEQIALPPTEIIPQSEFFDYQAKYVPGMSLEVTPPDMDKGWIAKIQEYSLLAHNSLGCSGYSRTDFIVTDDGIPWILETNTLPGMTGTSLVPQQAEKIGIPMKDVFNWLVRLGLERKNIPWPWV
ncbi:MAG: D-alanine--D-alanine ligase [Leptospira sp.]|nr:D-alanine--D-alanine ligase [Leptospira sp.]